MNRFIKHLCILTFAVIVASIFARSILTIWWPAIVGFFFIVSMVVYYLSDKAKQKDMRRFTLIGVLLTLQRTLFRFFAGKVCIFYEMLYIISLKN